MASFLPFSHGCLLVLLWHDVVKQDFYVDTGPIGGRMQIRKDPRVAYLRDQIILQALASFHIFAWVEDTRSVYICVANYCSALRS
jgi:hypothetical protein